jgi:phosphatidylinositol 4-kinase
MAEELSKIILQDKNSINRINSINSNKLITQRSINHENKLKSYKKSITFSNQLVKKKEDFLAEASPKIINPFDRNWQEVENEIKQISKFRNFETYEVKNFIAKANDDLRQELMTMQIIKRFDDIFKNAEIPLKLKPYEILITSPTSGLIEFIPNTISIDALKKKIFPETSLNIFFRNFFVNNFEEAQKNFAESLAAYSIVQHILYIKDR